MKRSIRILTALLILPAMAGLLQFGPLAGSPQAKAGGGVIQPEVTDALQQASEVAVIINLVGPATPIEDVTLQELQQNAAARQASVLAALTASDFTLSSQYESIHALAGRITSSGVQKLSGHPDVVSVSIDGEVFATLEQSVPLIHADQVHLAGFDGTGVEVAVLDTGIDTDHSDLADSITGQACFLQAPCPPPPNVAEDDNGHGTHVSGIVTSNGTVAPLGVAPGTGIYAIKVLQSTGGGDFSNIEAALDHIATPPNLGRFASINMSLGDGASYPAGTCRTDQPAISDALQFLRKNGTLPFASAGNSGSKSGIGWPACDPSVVSIGAVYDADVGTRSWFPCADVTTAADKVVCFSQSSADLDLLAPGSITLSTWPFSPFTASLSGTSMASPHAVAVSALMKDALPTLTPDAVEERLEAAGKLVTDDLHDADSTTNRTTPRVDARVALLTENNADFDQDGCTNGREFQTATGSQTSGGIRNPLDFWDFMDQYTGSPLARDRIVAIADVGAVVARFGTSGDPNGDPLVPPANTNGYHTSADRNGTYPGANPWDMRPPNGVITVGDIGSVNAQFGHSCV